MGLRTQVSLCAADEASGGADYRGVSVLERKPVRENLGWRAPQSIAELLIKATRAGARQIPLWARASTDVSSGAPEFRHYAWLIREKRSLPIRRSPARSMP